MSWLVAFETTPDAFDADAAEALQVATCVRAGDEFAPNAADQIEHGLAAMTVAIAAARAVVTSGAVGAGHFRVRLTGHANPGLVPQPGYANDHVGITVIQL